jgi:hypothetical protein
MGDVGQALLSSVFLDARVDLGHYVGDGLFADVTDNDGGHFIAADAHRDHFGS